MADERQYQQQSRVSRRATTIQTPSVKKPPEPLTEAEHARIKETIATIKEKAPAVVPLVKGLYELGMIDGWRSVTITKVE